MSRGAGDWADPGCFAVADGIHRIPLPMPQDGLRAINVYAVTGPDGVALIDAGWNVPGNLELLSDGLRALGADPSDVTDVHVTHIHRDHYTMGPELRRRFGTRVHLGRRERPGLEELLELRTNEPVSSLEQLRRAGAHEIADLARAETLAESWVADDWEPPDTWTPEGRIHVAGIGMEAVLTAGHTKGHLVFDHPAAGVTFTGDHVLPRISPSIGFELGVWDSPLGDFLDSLEAMLRRPDAEMLPAHGAPGGGVHDRVRELLGHHDLRLEATLDRVRDRPGATGLQVAEGLAWTRRERAFSTLDVFNQMIATCETMAHLDVLERRGAVAVTETGPEGAARYEVA